MLHFLKVQHLNFCITFSDVVVFNEKSFTPPGNN